MQNTQLDGMYRMASKFLGYTGPKTREALEQFRASSPAVAAKMKRYSNAMAKGGLMRKGYATGGTTTKTSPNSPSNLPNYQAFLNSPQYQQAQSQAASQVITPVTIGGQTYNFGNPVMAQAYQNFAASQSSSTPATTTSSTAPTASQAGATPFLTTPTVPTPTPVPPNATDEERKEIEDANKEAALDALAQAQQQTVMSTMTPYKPEAAQIQEQADQIISSTAGQAGTTSPAAVAAQTSPFTALANTPFPPAPTAQAATALAEPQVAATLAGISAAQGQLSSDAQVAAATQATSSVANVQAAQGTATMMSNPVQRQIEAGELVSGAADAATASAFAEQIQAAEATPSKKATVAGQLEGLMQQFQGGQTPAWASGAMRTATQMLAARGLGASSLAGQAVIQAAMEAALPIAQADAATMASFEAQNLSNRQQRAMLAAQQRATFIGQEFDQAFQARVQNSARIGDIANMNFTAEQQVALENSRAANTMNLQNLSNRQAVVMSQAAALANLDMANLSNRQQAAVQNAQSFLQMDMTNLSNEQQTNMFKAQQNVQALFTDQAEINAAAQFNAASENQTMQFFADLENQVSQFNASQINAMDQFNVDAQNAIRQFNSEQQQQRDLFNAQNSLIVSQANAQWRQNIATLNNAADNQANMMLAQTLNNLSMSNIEKIWQRERDLLTFAVQVADSNANRATQIAVQKLANEADTEVASTTAAGAKSAAFANAAGSIVAKIIGL